MGVRESSLWWGGKTRGGGGAGSRASRYFGIGSFATTFYVAVCAGLELMATRGAQRPTQIKQLDGLICMLQGYRANLADEGCAELDAYQSGLVRRRALRMRVARQQVAAQKFADSLMAPECLIVRELFPSLSQEMALVLATRVGIEEQHWGSRQAERCTAVLAVKSL